MPKKPKDQVQAGPPFPLGDPDGVVAWTPQMLKKVFPRRELAPKPPPALETAAYWAILHENAEALWPAFEAGRAHPHADPELFAAFARVRERLAGPPPTAPLSPEGEAPLLHFAEPFDSMRQDPLGAQTVDLWVKLGGLAFAVRAVALAHTFTVAQAPGEHACRLNAGKLRPGFGDYTHLDRALPAYVLFRTSHLSDRTLQADQLPEVHAARSHLNLLLAQAYSWLRLRHHLAAAPEAQWRDAVAAADALRAESADPVLHHLLAFCFPEIPQWAEALAQEPHPGLQGCLSASVRDPAGLDSRVDDYFWTFSDQARASMLAAAGPRAARALARRLDLSWPGPAARHAGSLLACIGTEEAMKLLLDRPKNKHAVAALAEAQARFPDLVARVQAGR